MALDHFPHPPQKKPNNFGFDRGRTTISKTTTKPSIALIVLHLDIVANLVRWLVIFDHKVFTYRVSLNPFCPRFRIAGLKSRGFIFLYFDGFVTSTS
jgi:hypothetical protein